MVVAEILIPVCGIREEGDTFAGRQRNIPQGRPGVFLRGNERGEPGKIIVDITGTFIAGKVEQYPGHEVGVLYFLRGLTD